MRRVVLGAVVLGGAFLLLAVPGSAPSVGAAPRGAAPFVWDRDAYWTALAARFTAARAAGCDAARPQARRDLSAVETLLGDLERSEAGPDAPELDSLERAFFEAGPLVACPDLVAGYVALQSRLRAAVKDRSIGWDMASPVTRARLYRLLYGSRAAVEEVVLQQPGAAPARGPRRGVPSAAPSAIVQGVRVHSGDLLVSRGGAPTSALIARGNDYPGNFSHVALVHVDSATGTASAVEAHIETGVSIAGAEAYLRDRKLRILVLRLRPDLPALRRDPLLPHRAAARALARAASGHVAYDFAMDYTDPSKLFCSEVASSVYGELGVTLWTGLSTISGAGLRRWLAAFGVRRFETQEPSDLEYDPNLVVVAEWRDPASLAADHVDNAVVDAMLEGAERGDALDLPWHRLPLARLAKAYSWLALKAGGTGPVPEGMSASAALRHQAFSARQRRLAAAVAERAEAHRREQGYAAPYWTLLRFAREAAR